MPDSSFLPSRVPESGCWESDNNAGRECADRLLMEIRRRQSVLIFTNAIRDTVNQGRWGGVEVGFTHRISEVILSSN